MTGWSRPAACLVLAGMLAGCGPSLPGPAQLRLTSCEVVAAAPAERIYQLRFTSARRDTVVAFLREPRTPGPHTAVVLVSGRETGRQAAAVIPGPLEEAVLALEYPATIPQTMDASAWARQLPALRRTALHMPGTMRGAARWLAAQPGIDSTRIALVGVSFGVPFAAAAGHDRIFRGVALHHGGADLALLLRTNLPIENRVLRSGISGFGAWWLRRLEPARHVGRISPTPLLLINGEHDDLIPRRSAERLRLAAREPVRQLWLPHGHLMPDDTAAMRELADSTLSHFGFLRRERPAGGSVMVPDRCQVALPAGAPHGTLALLVHLGYKPGEPFKRYTSDEHNDARIRA
ncbi:MAG: prolyl oligopeptidase family serine peptidase [Gemmatimonadota bacterium]|nr:prolyl oligopeptidase family serine peptidase [Gemmatimonadota bacterium]